MDQVPGPGLVRTVQVLYRLQVGSVVRAHPENSQCTMSAWAKVKARVDDERALDKPVAVDVAPSAAAAKDLGPRVKKSRAQRLREREKEFVPALEATMSDTELRGFRC